MKLIIAFSALAIIVGRLVLIIYKEHTRHKDTDKK